MGIVGNVWKKAKDVGKKVVNEVKEHPLETVLLVASVGLSAYGAVSGVKRGDQLELVGTGDVDDSETTEEDATDNSETTEE